MSWGFEAGRVYNRGVDIHSRFGGQQQGGIITPAQHPIVIIITGEEGLGRVLINGNARFQAGHVSLAFLVLLRRIIAEF